ncbi:hypothetical protein B0H13DRAFT_2331119 [Mycena leptocephala]|nr:hypothetical protein B0H13DRAFT_2331119 [Mycena leptocephala]
MSGASAVAIFFGSSMLAISVDHRIIHDFGVHLRLIRSISQLPIPLVPRTAMQYTVNSRQFDPAWDVSLLVYGIYVIFFLLSIYALSPRRKTPGIKFLIAARCVMGVLGTTQMAATIAVTLVDARFVQQIVYRQV